MPQTIDLPFTSDVDVCSVARLTENIWLVSYPNMAFICGHEHHVLCVAPHGPRETWRWDSSFIVAPEVLVQKLTEVVDAFDSKVEAHRL